jgi:hypothetical protein
MEEMSFPLSQVYAMEPRSVEEEEVGPLRWDPPVVPEMEEEESVRPPTPPPPPPPEQYPLLYHPNVLRSLGYLVDERPSWSIPLQPGEYPPNMRIVGSQTPRSEILVQTEWLPYDFQPYFFARDTLSTDIVPSIGSSSTIVSSSTSSFSTIVSSSIDSSSVDQFVPSYDVHSSPLRSAGQILAANVSEESHSVPDNDWLEEPN